MNLFFRFCFFNMDYTTYYIGNAYLCKKFECLLIVYRRTIREFINMVNINRIKAYIRAIVVLNVDGSSPSGHPKVKVL